MSKNTPFVSEQVNFFQNTPVYMLLDCRRVTFSLFLSFAFHSLFRRARCVCARAAQNRRDKKMLLLPTCQGCALPVYANYTIIQRAVEVKRQGLGKAPTVIYAPVD